MAETTCRMLEHLLKKRTCCTECGRPIELEDTEALEVLTEMATKMRWGSSIPASARKAALLHAVRVLQERIGATQ